MQLLSPEAAAVLRAELAARPGAMLQEVARTHGVPEYAVLAVLGPPRAVPLDVAQWEALLHALPELGRVRVLVSNSGVTMETQGRFGGFSRTGDYFNVQTSSLDMHLRESAIGGAMAVEKPSHQTGHPTASVQLFDHAGNAILKVFLLFGDEGAHPDARRDAFSALRARFALPVAAPSA